MKTIENNLAKILLQDKAYDEMSKEDNEIIKEKYIGVVME